MYWDSHTIKFNLDSASPSDVQLLFSFLFLAISCGGGQAGTMRNGLSKEGREKEYAATYAMASSLLLNFSGTGKSFFLVNGKPTGNCLNLNASSKPPPQTVNGLIQFLNVRQSAVEECTKSPLASHRKCVSQSLHRGESSA